MNAELLSTGAFYLRMVRDYPESWRRFFEVMADSEGYSILYHCTAGRDRTGVATVLLLEALGVSRDEIITDYVRSNEAFSGSPKEAEVLDDLFGWIDAGGGIDAVLSGHLEVPDDAAPAIRAHLLV